MEAIGLQPVPRLYTPGNTPMVLVCEGEDIIRKLLIRYIEYATHWEVHGAGDGHLATQFLNIRTYDMVVSSLFLDFTNGLEMLHFLRKEKHSSIPFILMTSDTGEETAIRAFEMGADDVVEKPINMKELVARMKYQMQKRRMHSPSWNLVH